MHRPDGETPIPGAEVTLAARPANGPTDTTDAIGVYTLVGVPAGNQSLLARRGAFEARFTVSVRANETVTAAPAQVSSVGKLAYVPGSFDEIEAIVRDSLQHPSDELAPDQLGNAALLAQYAMIFLNCGFDDFTLLDDPAARQTLRRG